jgi:hypothetical protein
MGYFVMVFVLLIAAAGLGYVAGHPPGRTAPTTAVTAKPANPTPRLRLRSYRQIR